VSDQKDAILRWSIYKNQSIPREALYNSRAYDSRLDRLHAILMLIGNYRASFQLNMKSRRSMDKYFGVKSVRRDTSILRTVAVTVTDKNT